MSTGKRVALWQAQQVADDFIGRIQDVAAETHVVGSISRKVPTVGDIEIVVLPLRQPDFWNRIDVLLHMGSIQRAIYPDGTHRWGDSYRGLMYAGHRIELFTCDAHNRGYITWLRTGPRDANVYVMSVLSRHKSQVRFEQGSGWEVTYEGDETIYLKRLSIPDEWTLFQLLGMPLIRADIRSQTVYARYLARGVNCPQHLSQYYAPLDEPQQKRLF